jgi:hypothetical protein
VADAPTGSAIATPAVAVRRARRRFMTTFIGRTGIQREGRWT